MHGAHIDLFALLVLLAGSLGMPLLATRVHVPSAVLLIIYGTVVGPNLVGLVSHGQVVTFLYEVGFIVLMFLAGLEIDVNEIRRRGLRSLFANISAALAIFGLSFATALLLGLPPIYGLALGATSVGLPLAVLKETGNLRTSFGQRIIQLTSVGEFLTLLGMTLFYFGSRYGLSVELAIGLGRLLSMLVGAGLVLRIMMAIAWWKPSRFSWLVESGHSELGVRAALLTMMAFSLVAIAAGVESIVGAFSAGALIAFVLRGKRALEERLGIVGHGLFVPLFFIIVGMRFDPRVVTLPNLMIVAMLLLTMLVARLIPASILLRSSADRREVLATAALLSAPLTLLVAIAALGAEIGAIPAGARGTLVLLAIASGAIFPMGYRVLHRLRELQKSGDT